MADIPQATPGWYPDPQMPGTQRYWDGAAWSDHVAPAAPPQVGISVWKGVRIVALAEPIPISYHVAFNHRKASADACTMIIEAVGKIVGQPIAKSPVMA